MIKEWLEEYKPIDKLQAEATLREIMQELALAGLQGAAFLRERLFTAARRCASFTD